MPPVLCKHIGKDGTTRCLYRDGKGGRVCRFIHPGAPEFERLWRDRYGEEFDWRTMPGGRFETRQDPWAQTSSEDRFQSDSRRSPPRGPASSGAQQPPSRPAPPTGPRASRGMSFDTSSRVGSVSEHTAPPLTSPSVKSPQHSRNPSYDASTMAISGTNLPGPARVPASNHTDADHPERSGTMDKKAFGLPDKGKSREVVPPSPLEATVDQPGSAQTSGALVSGPRERAIRLLVDITTMRIRQLELTQEGTWLERLENEALATKMDPENLSVLEGRHREKKVALKQLISEMTDKINVLISMSNIEKEDPESASTSTQRAQQLQAQLQKMDNEIDGLSRKFDQNMQLLEGIKAQKPPDQLASHGEGQMEVDSNPRPAKRPRVEDPASGRLTPVESSSKEILAEISKLQTQMGFLEGQQEDLDVEIANRHANLENALVQARDAKSAQMSARNSVSHSPVPPDAEQQRVADEAQISAEPWVVSVEDAKMLVDMVRESHEEIERLQSRLGDMTLSKLQQRNEELTQRVTDLEGILRHREDEQHALRVIIEAISSQEQPLSQTKELREDLIQELREEVFNRVQPLLLNLKNNSQRALEGEGERIRLGIEEKLRERGLRKSAS